MKFEKIVSIPQIGEILIKYRTRFLPNGDFDLSCFNPLDRGNSNQMYLFSGEYSFYEMVSIPQIGEILIKSITIALGIGFAAICFNPLDRGNSNQMQSAYQFIRMSGRIVSIPQIGEILIKFIVARKLRCSHRAEAFQSPRSGKF